MQTHLGAGLVGRLTRWLPTRRWQTAHWLGKLFVPRRPFVGRFLDGYLEVRPGEIASNAAFYTGFYEREVTMWCLEHLRNRPPELIVDVGANFGYYPLLFGLKTAGKTTAIAFEPDPSNFAWLSRNLALNPSLNITAVHEAVSDIGGQLLPFESAKEGHNLFARVPLGSSQKNEHAAATVEVRSVTLDGYLEQNSIPRVDLTLVDVEGHESRVIEGMAKGIANRRYRAVMIEFHPWAFADPATELARIADHFLAHRLRHLESGATDKDLAFFCLTWCDSMLAPMSYDSRGPWEHYLFTCSEE